MPRPARYWAREPMTLEGYELEGKGYFGPGEMPVFDAGFFAMPHGGSDEWAFDQFKDKAKAAGGDVSDEMLAELKNDIVRSLFQATDNVGMMDEDADYI